MACTLWIIFLDSKIVQHQNKTGIGLDKQDTTGKMFFKYKNRMQKELKNLKNKTRHPLSARLIRSKPQNIKNLSTEIALSVINCPYNMIESEREIDPVGGELTIWTLLCVKI